MLTHPKAVASDVDDVTVVKEPIDQRGGHDFITKDVAPLLEAFVARKHGGGVLVAAAHELEEVHGSGARDRQVADFVYD